jgi:hypothetical protein
MADLEGKTIAATYRSVLNVGTSSNQELDGNLRVIEDGAGNDSVLYLATDSALISGDETKLYFYDADGGESIRADNAGILFLAAASEIDLTATAIDINGTGDVSGTLTVGGTLTVNAATVFNEGSSDYDFRVESNGNQNMLFVDGGTNNVGIGTGTPANITSGVVLHVYGGLHGFVYADGTQDSGFKILNSGTMQWEIFNSTGDSDKLLIRDADSNHGVYIVQDATSWSAGSDINLKTDISSISDALSKVNSIRGVNFKWKRYKSDGESPNPDRDRNRIGCIAQEVNEVLPEAVDTSKDGEWGISYTTLVPLLVEAVKELSVSNDALKARIEVLEAA